MTKHFFAIMVMTVMSAGSFGQTTSQKLEQVKRDPKTTENAAKADALLVDKKNVSDSSVSKPAILKPKEQGRKSKRKKSSCKAS